MKFSNIVRFQPKDGEMDNVMAILSQDHNLDGLIQSFVVKTGHNSCCSVGIWESEAHIVNARPQMVQILDKIRDKLVIISEELGVTDPMSGPIIQEL